MLTLSKLSCPAQLRLEKLVDMFPVPSFVFLYCLEAHEGTISMVLALQHAEHFPPLATVLRPLEDTTLPLVPVLCCLYNGAFRSVLPCTEPKPYRKLSQLFLTETTGSSHPGPEVTQLTWPCPY